MIPKKIHYCWFGKKKLPDDVIQCMQSWKKYCPDYEIFEWNEDNYDVTKNPYMKEAYEAKKWAFVSDYARLDILYQNGGIYLDTDVELIKSLDILLKNKAFFGEEEGGFINTGLGFGAEPFNEAIYEMLKQYEKLHFLIKGKLYNYVACPYYNTTALFKFGFDQTNEDIQQLGVCSVFPIEFFAPKNLKGELNITSNTYSIHHYSSSWKEENEQSRMKRIKEDYLKSDILNPFLYFIYKIKQKIQIRRILSYYECNKKEGIKI